MFESCHPDRKRSASADLFLSVRPVVYAGSASLCRVASRLASLDSYATAADAAFGPSGLKPARYSCFNALASWSGQLVPRPEQSMPSRRAMTSETFMPTQSEPTP